MKINKGRTSAGRRDRSKIAISDCKEEDVAEIETLSIRPVLFLPIR